MVATFFDAEATSFTEIGYEDGEDAAHAFFFSFEGHEDRRNFEVGEGEDF